MIENALMMSMPSGELAGLAIQAGISTVILDMEHGFPGLREVSDAIPATRAHGGKCVVRIARGMAAWVGPLADIEVDGLILSGPRSVTDVEEFVALARFPPAGTRSANPFVAAAGTPGSMDGLARNGALLELWAMAETASLLEELQKRGPEPILGLQQIMVGPFDLALDLNISPEPSKALAEAVGGFVEWADLTRTEWSIFVRDPTNVGKWRDYGIHPRRVVLGYDRDIWFSSLRERIAAVGGLSTNADTTQFETERGGR